MGCYRDKDGSWDSQLIHKCFVELSRPGLWEGLQGSSGEPSEAEPGASGWPQEWGGGAWECSTCPLWPYQEPHIPSIIPPLLDRGLD